MKAMGAKLWYDQTFLGMRGSSEKYFSRMNSSHIRKKMMIALPRTMGAITFAWFQFVGASVKPKTRRRAPTVMKTAPG